MVKYFYLIIFFIFSSCSLKYDELEDYIWKYSEGLYLGDVYFIVKENLKNDTIYIKNIPKYYIKTNKGYFGLSTELIIKDIKTGKEGRYIEK